MERRFFSFMVLNVLMIFVASERVHKKNAYATIMYMGTPRDYEFYVATRVMLKSLEKLKVDADLVVLASMDVPYHWVRILSMFHPPPNGTLDGTYRLPLGYQMDAFYYYIKLRWNVPCGPNSIITFPGAPSLKPWYWWSWPVLPLGYQWHQQRLQTLGYGDEMPVVLMEASSYLGIMAIAHLTRPNLSKLCYRRDGKSSFLIRTGIKMIAIWSLLVAYIIPCFLVPHTIHPVMGWGLYLLGAASLCTVVVHAFILPTLPIFVPWLGILGSLVVMAYPGYYDGIARALSIFGYAFCCAPFLWVSFVKILTSLQVSLEREAFAPRLAENSSPAAFNKLY